MVRGAQSNRRRYSHMTADLDVAEGLLAEAGVSYREVAE